METLSSWSDQDRVVDSIVMALSEYDTPFLTAVAESAEDVNPDGWLPKMIREYVCVWR